MWFNEQTGEFWCYDEDGRCLYTTSGRLNGSKLIFSTIQHCGENIEEHLLQVLEQKIASGFECFAVQI